MPERPRFADRLWDATSLIFVLGGIGLFVLSRRALTRIGDGTFQMPAGMSAVAQTDMRVAQSRLGMVILGLGLVLGVMAAVRHKLR